MWDLTFARYLNVVCKFLVFFLLLSFVDNSGRKQHPESKFALDFSLHTLWPLKSKSDLILQLSEFRELAQYGFLLRIHAVVSCLR